MILMYISILLALVSVHSLPTTIQEILEIINGMIVTHFNLVAFFMKYQGKSNQLSLCSSGSKTVIK